MFWVCLNNLFFFVVKKVRSVKLISYKNVGHDQQIWKMCEKQMLFSLDSSSSLFVGFNH